MNDHDLWHEIQDFLIREARLLDDRAFEEWLDLFTDDIVYWMPERTNPWESSDLADTVSKPGELALFEETKETLRTRVARLATGMAWSEVPPSRTRHLVTNVQVESGENESELRGALLLHGVPDPARAQPGRLCRRAGRRAAKGRRRLEDHPPHHHTGPGGAAVAQPEHLLLGAQA